MSRTIRLLLSCCVLATVAMTAVPAEGPTTTSTEVGRDRCDGSDLVLPEHDACSWTMTTTTAEDTAPVLELRLNTAGAGDELADGALLVWSSGDCAFFLDHDSGTGLDVALPSGSALQVGCGEETRECIEVAGHSTQCSTTYEQEALVAVPRGTRDGRDLVWTLTFEGDLAEWADLHDRGATLRPGLSTVGPRLPESPTLAAFTCGTDTPCLDIGGDFIVGLTTHTVG